MSELQFTDAELKALRAEHAPNATDEQFELWIADCKRRNLVPVRDVILQIRTATEWDDEVRRRVKKKKAIYITTIGAFRKIAERTQKYAGQKPSAWIYLDPNGERTESDIPLPKHGSSEPRLPWAVKVSVLRKDFQEPLTAVARFGAYAQTYNADGAKQLTSMWASRGPEQLEKCAEALALRKAFPEELGGLYIAEEMMKTDEHEQTEEGFKQIEQGQGVPLATAMPEVNHTPAEAREEPRPGEEKKKRGRKKAEPEPEPTPAPKEKLEITDDDIPDFDAPPEADDSAEDELDFDKHMEQAEAAQSADNRLPNKDERIAFGTKLRGFDVDKEALRDFLLRYAKVDDTSAITVVTWNKALAKLEAAQEAGVLKEVITGKVN